MKTINDFKIEKQEDIKICDKHAKITKITNKKNKKISYTCSMLLSVNKETKKEAIKEIEFLMTIVNRLKK